MDNNTKRNCLRLRYGRVISEGFMVPKNTLVTIKNGNLVHFGISRCNMDAGDKFNKERGKLIALNRALAAESESDVTTEDFTVHYSGLRGTVNINSIKSLIQYFRTIDDSMVPKYIDKQKAKVIRAEV